MRKLSLPLIILLIMAATFSLIALMTGNAQRSGDATSELEQLWRANMPTTSGGHTIYLLSNGVRDCYVISPDTFRNASGSASISCVNRP